jgi:hypothetical protein
MKAYWGSGGKCKIFMGSGGETPHNPVLSLDADESSASNFSVLISGK